MTLTRLPPDSYTLAAQEDRCARRTRLSMAATLRPSGQAAFSVIVRDLSLGGFACEAATTMRGGHLCWITLPGLGTLQAQVVWNDGMMVGCAFENLLEQAVVESVVARLAAR